MEFANIHCISATFSNNGLQGMFQMTGSILVNKQLREKNWFKMISLVLYDCTADTDTVMYIM